MERRELLMGLAWGRGRHRRHGWQVLCSPSSLCSPSNLWSPSSLCSLCSPSSLGKSQRRVLRG